MVLQAVGVRHPALLPAALLPADTGRRLHPAAVHLGLRPGGHLPARPVMVRPALPDPAEHLRLNLRTVHLAEHLCLNLRTVHPAERLDLKHRMRRPALLLAAVFRLDTRRPACLLSLHLAMVRPRVQQAEAMVHLPAEAVTDLLLAEVTGRPPVLLAEVTGLLPARPVAAMVRPVATARPVAAMVRPVAMARLAGFLPVVSLLRPAQAAPVVRPEAGRRRTRFRSVGTP